MLASAHAGGHWAGAHARTTSRRVRVGNGQVGYAWAGACTRAGGRLPPRAGDRRRRRRTGRQKTLLGSDFWVLDFPLPHIPFITVRINSLCTTISNISKHYVFTYLLLFNYVRILMKIIFKILHRHWDRGSDYRLFLVA